MDLGKEGAAISGKIPVRSRRTALHTVFYRYQASRGFVVLFVGFANIDAMT